MSGLTYKWYPPIGAGNLTGPPRVEEVVGAKERTGAGAPYAREAPSAGDELAGPPSSRVGTQTPSAASPGGPAGSWPTDADGQLLAVYLGLYPRLVRSAAYLLGGSAPAEDAVQEAYVRVLSKRPALRDPERLGAYLRAAVVNVCRATERRRKMAERYLAGHARARRAASDAEVLPADGAFARHELVVALRALPRRQREVVVLRHYAGFSEAETAAALGLPVGTVKSAASRGLRNLAETLGGER